MNEKLFRHRIGFHARAKAVLIERLHAQKLRGVPIWRTASKLCPEHHSAFGAVENGEDPQRWPAAGTTVETLVAVEGHRWAIEDSFETAKNEFGLVTVCAVG